MSGTDGARKKHQWSYRLIDSAPDKGGVYAFWCRSNGRCIYVGQAMSIRKRLSNHWKNAHSDKLHLWLKVFANELDLCYTLTNNERIERFERRLIKRWKPEANDTFNPNS